MQRPFRLAAYPASRRFALVMAALAAAGCRGLIDAPSSTDRPTLRLIDSILLEEADSTLLSDPGPYFLIDRIGRMYIPDEQSSRIQRYAANGGYELTFGRRGRDPANSGSWDPRCWWWIPGCS